MSFSSEVKEELCRKVHPARHCQIGEIAAILFLCGKVAIDEDDQFSLMVQTENVSVARKYYTLVKTAFSASPTIATRKNEYLKKSRIYRVTVGNHKDAERILKAAKMMDADGNLAEDLDLVKHTLLQRVCCKRAFIRGAFLAAGSLSDPEKNYHFEIVCTKEEKARQIQSVMNDFDLDAKIIVRKKYYVVYLKESSSIVDVLNIMEAPLALMKLENVRIVKDVRNSVNRRVNCETANINKTVAAAVKQIEDIRYIEASGGFGDLSPELLDTAKIRLQYPDMSLKELGTMLNPPVGKSGVNHRLRKLSELAQKLREKTTT
ncbi:MAG: DNA-binding protein WhiA [Lachnospiraceae bacterium]|nr:DNA-binding protein WhiA [Lachnospiraceae bacterium]